MAQIDTVAGTPVFTQSFAPGVGATAAVFFRAGMQIDCDGSPRSYGPNNTGEDYMANAGVPGDWFGVLTTPSGKPVVQGPDDPAPGFYVSTTSLQDPDYRREDPRRYVDADTIPFIVLPGRHFAAWGVQLGDLAWLRNVENGHCTPAIFADGGPRDKIGEGSSAAAVELGLNPDPRRGGTSKPIIQCFVFAGSGTGRPMALEEINARVQAMLPALRTLGGVALPPGAV